MRAGRRHKHTERDRLIVGGVIAALAAGLAALAFVSTNGLPLQSGYRVDTVLPVGAPTITVGDTVRVAGLYEGSVASVSRAQGGGQLLKLNLRASPIGRDARIVVRLQAAAGQYYLAIARGDYRDAPLRSGGAIPTAQDGYAESLPAALAGFSSATLGDLRRSLQLTGAGVYDRGLALNQAFDGLNGTVSDTTAVLDAVTPGDELPLFTRSSAVVARSLQGTAPDDAGRLTTAAANLFGALASTGSRVGTTIDELPAFEHTALDVLPQIDPLLDRTTVLAGRLRPAVAALQRALPSLTATLRDGPSLATYVPPLVAAGTPALRTLQPVLGGIEPNAILLTRDLPPLGTLAAYVERFPQEVLNGFGTYYYATLYHAEVGSAPGYAAAAVQLVLTCVPGFNPHPAPGSVYTDHLTKLCD